jgi:hypothetical protein
MNPEKQKRGAGNSSAAIVPRHRHRTDSDPLDAVDIERYRSEAYLVYGIDDPQRFGSRDVVEGVVGRHVAMRRLQAKGGLTLYEMATLAKAMSSDYLLAGCSQQEWASRVRPFGCAYAQYRKLVQLADIIEEGYLTDWEKTFKNASMTVILDALSMFGYVRSLMRSGETESARLFAAFIERFLQSPYATQENLAALRQAGIVEKWPSIFKSIKETQKESEDSARGFFDAVFPGMDGDDEPPSDDSPFIRFVAGLSTGGLNDLSDVETATTTTITAANATRRRRAVRNANADASEGESEPVVRLSWNDNPYAVEDRPKAVVEMTTDDGSYCTITIVNAPVSILSVLSQFVRLVDKDDRRIDVTPF